MKNIRSYVDEEINFPEGSVLLSGDVGSGKSTILLSIDFALFGTKRGEISGSELLRHGSNSGSVELMFSLDGKDVRIKRSLKRSKNIVQDSGLLEVNGAGEELTATELRARISDMFGYPRNRKESVFRYTVYTPQEEMKHILISDERLPVLRRIFGIDKYGIIKENAKIVCREFRAMKREYLVFVSDLSAKEAEKKSAEKLCASLLEEKSKIAGALSETGEKISACAREMNVAENKMKEFMATKELASKKESEIFVKKRSLAEIQKRLHELWLRTDAYRKEQENYISLAEPEKTREIIAKELKTLDEEKTLLISKSAYLRSDTEKMSAIMEKRFCEVCGQKVHDPASFASQIEEKHKETKEVISKLEEVQKKIAENYLLQEKWIQFTRISEKKNSLEKMLSVLSTDMEKLVSQTNIIGKEIADDNALLETLRLSLESNKHQENEVSRLRQAMDKLLAEKLVSEKLLSRVEQQLSDTKTRLLVLEKEVNEKKRCEEKIACLNSITSWAEEDFAEMMDVMEKHVMTVIQKEFDDYFRSWFSIIMGDEALSVRIDDTFSPVIEQNSFETDYINLSGGEKTAVALAYRLSLNKVINSLIDNIKTKDLLILDEPTDGFSSSQLDRIRYVIEELGHKQIILVSHEPKIDTFVDNVIQVYKENHTTRIS